MASLLVLVAIQGITPDPDDLASMRLVRLLETILAAQPTSAIHDPSRENGNDQSPDEVCTPAHAAGYGVMRRNEGHIAGLSHPLASPFKHILGSGDPRSTPGGRLASGADLIHALCRMTC